jgi:E3 ubiquitin-protein ligase HERC2
MINWTPSTYWRTTNLYVVTFLGENSIDAGGPYRETLSQYCAELQSSQLPLLLPSPNGQHNVGSHLDAWVLHPSSHKQHSGMLVFLGKLLGVAIRTKYCLSLNLSQVVWKLLVQDPITLEDLEAIDTLVVSSMKSLRTIEQSGVTEEMFADIMHETMTTLSTDNRMVELVEGGDAIPVAFAMRHQFADLVEAYRMHEFDVAAGFLRQGLGMVVPLRLLHLFTWMELESLVCGTPDIDIDLLVKCTEYSGCSEVDRHVVWFWEVLREYNQEARQAFLRFVWGRSRLPRSVQEFQSGQQFKLQVLERHPADVYMPVSHTCFFSLELPRYTSREVLSSRLTYAIYNCVAIDGDTNTVQANQLGWED